MDAPRRPPLEEKEEERKPAVGEEDEDCAEEAAEAGRLGRTDDNAEMDDDSTAITAALPSLPMEVGVRRCRGDEGRRTEAAEALSIGASAEASAGMAF